MKPIDNDILTVEILLRLPRWLRNTLDFEVWQIRANYGLFFCAGFLTYHFAFGF